MSRKGHGGISPAITTVADRAALNSSAMAEAQSNPRYVVFLTTRGRG